ncbi:hypothetical protein SAY86_004311 [Trapa natans]|uniref:RING-type domain-containing protein n=1 Tax=Trapa natans TaxID=22666 RepID=A0AAN7MFS4_TRANT|nr:hypothetical protein SAY86_004311 [Trapa natans]
MAVEARHNILPPHQLLANRYVKTAARYCSLHFHLLTWFIHSFMQFFLFSEMVRPVEANASVIASLYNHHLQIGGGYGLPLSETTTTDTMALLPMYSSPAMDYIPTKTPIRSDSGLTHKINSIPLILSRKRSRDAANQNQIMPYAVLPAYQQKDYKNRSTNFSFLGEDISLHVEQQQLDINHIIAHHIEKVRSEIEERRRNQTRRILYIVEERIAKRLRTKEEEIDKIARLNWALEEKIKTLCMENQIWRELAQTNEATANALRTNLEQVLAHVDKDGNVVVGGRSGGLNDGGATTDNRHHPLADDAESCCDSSSPGGDDRVGAAGCTSAYVGNDGRWCRSCRMEEARVLLLPCRHLCLCTVCGSSVHTCPVCNSAKTASVHINVS